MHTQVLKVLKVLMIQIHHKSGSVLKEGGLLLSVSVEEPASTSQNTVTLCTVAVAGPWCSGLKTRRIKKELGQMTAPVLSFVSNTDNEELSDFVNAWGSQNVHLSMQITGSSHTARADWSGIEQFLFRLSLVHAQVNMYYMLKISSTVYRRIFRSRLDSAFTAKGRCLNVDSTLYGRHPLPATETCSRLHVVLSRAVPLLLPLRLIEMGLCGETSLLLMAALSPCVAKYPNLPAHVTNVHILLYGPSNLPVLCEVGNSRHPFLYKLGEVVPWEKFGLSGVRCSERTDPGSPCPDVAFVVDEADVEHCTVHQTLTVFLFAQHSDPFLTQLSDFVATEDALQQNLDEVLQLNEGAVVSALCSTLACTLHVSSKRSKEQAKMQAALTVILNSVIGVVSSSSSLDFRTACFNSMKVQDTPELAVAVQQSLRSMTQERFLSKCSCDNRKPSDPNRVSGYDQQEGVTNGDTEGAEGHCDRAKKILVRKRRSAPTPPSGPGGVGHNQVRK